MFEELRAEANHLQQALLEAIKSGDKAEEAHLAAELWKLERILYQGTGLEV